MIILQGDIFLVDLGIKQDSSASYRQPYVIIQNDVFNTSHINTTLGIALTTDLSKAHIPGNVLLEKDEANLQKLSVINTTQIITIDKSDLKEKIGHLSQSRIDEILRNLNLITEPKEI